VSSSLNTHAAETIAPESPVRVEVAEAPVLLAPAIDEAVVAALAPRVEALLVASGRAVSPARLAGALGLMPMETLAAGGETAPAPTGEDEAASPAPARRPRKRKADSGPSPIELVKAAVDRLNDSYTQSQRSFRIEAVAGGFRVMTLPAHARDIAALHGATAQGKLSKPSLETLAIIAYRQPVTRATVEAIRGVACGETIKTLLERRLITIAGRAEELGRPMLYATTRQFLEAFGLSSLKDLPSAGELGLKG
jgi:segregation and condensation protein B